MKVIVLICCLFSGAAAFSAESRSVRISECQLNEGYSLGIKDSARYANADIKECISKGFYSEEQCKSFPAKAGAWYRAFQQEAGTTYKEKQLQNLQITITTYFDNFGHEDHFSAEVLDGLSPDKKEYSVIHAIGGGATYNPPQVEYNIWEGPNWSGWFVSFHIGEDYEAKIDHYTYYPESPKNGKIRVVLYDTVDGTKGRDVILTCQMRRLP